MSWLVGGKKELNEREQEMDGERERERERQTAKSEMGHVGEAR